MTNSKFFLFLLVCVFLQSAKMSAQIFEIPSFSGQLSRSNSVTCPNPIVAKNTEVRVTTVGGDLLTSVQSDNYGNYSANVGLMSFIVVSPDLNTNASNGLTTYDCALISGHIFNNTPFLDPYQKLAADADGNGIINEDDNKLIRRVIFHIQSDLHYIVYKLENGIQIPYIKGVNSWRFVPQYYLNNPTFLNAFNLNPFSASFQGNCYTATGCTNSYMDKVTLEPGSGDSGDFIPFKVGDVNCSFDPLSMAVPIDENISSPDMLTSNVSNNRYNIKSASNISMQKADEKTIVLKTKGVGHIVAFQMGFRFLASQLSINSIEKSNFYTSNDIFDFNNEDKGKLRALWYDKRGKERIIPEGTVLLKAKVKANTNIDDILNVLNLDDKILQNEFYDINGNLVNMDLYWEEEKDKNNSLNKKSLEVNTYPNPFNDNLTFDIFSQVNDEATITISNLITGQKMEIKRAVTKGLNTITINNTSELPLGMLIYTVRCSGNQTVSGHIAKLK